MNLSGGCAARQALALGILVALLSSCSAKDTVLSPVEITEPFEFGEQPEQQWARKVDGMPLDASVFLAQDGERVYVLDEKGLTAFAAENGKIAWRTEIGTVAAGTALSDGLAVVSTFEGTVQGLNSDSGEIVWAAEVPGEVLAPAAISGGKVLVQTTNGRIFALSSEDGEIDWQQKYAVPPLTLHGTAAPTAGAGQVLVLDSSCKAHAYRQSDGVLVWEKVLHLPEGNNELERLVDADAQPVVLRQAMYIACYNGQLAMLQPTSGDIVWKKAFSTRRNLLLKRNLLLAVNQASELTAHHALNGKDIWESEALHYRRLSDPVIWNDRLVIGDLEGYIHLFELEEGEQTGRIRPFAKEIRALLASGDTLYALSVDGEVKAFAPPQ